MDDVYTQWQSRERRQKAWLRKRPVCAYCEEHIQEDYCYEINGECVCSVCLDREFRKATEDFYDAFSE